MSSDDYAIYRIAGSLTTLFIHVKQLLDIAQTSAAIISQTPELKHLESLGPRYVTVWNVILQILYASFTVFYDVRTIISKDYVVPESVKKLRYTIFSGLVFPIGMGIPLTFWPIFFYDRQLIFPVSADLLVTPTQNLMAHGGVFIYAVWELVFLPRNSIKNNLKTITYTLAFCMTYVITLFYTRYVDKGIWCYDLLTVTEGTNWFFFAFSGPIATALLGYFAQWKIRDAVWERRDAKSKIQ